MNLARQENFRSTHDTYYAIEGNIGCGKSTFISILKERFPQLQWIEQPVSEWQSVPNCGTNMLQRYYNEPKRWGFTFQMYAILTRIKSIQTACDRYPHKTKISERSILSDKYIFSEIMKDLEYMDPSEHQIFKSIFATLESQFPIKNTKIIYLRCNPQKCHERTQLRKRTEQKQIPVEYLQMIHQKHENWFKNYDPSKVLIIDTTKNFKDDIQMVENMVEKLQQFINQKRN